MAWHVEESTGDIVVNGFEQGIAQDPYSGIADLRNVDIITVPHEASVGFSSTAVSAATLTASVQSADSTTEIITYIGATGTFENRMAVTFSGGSLPGGIVAGTIYWLNNVSGNTTAKLYTDVTLTLLLNITSTGTGTMTTVAMGQPKHGFTISGAAQAGGAPFGNAYLIDANGRVWSNQYTTVGSDFWTFLGNTTLTNANGNGLSYYVGSDGKVWLFVFRNSRIDYTQLTGSTPSTLWIYGWNPTTGAAGTDALVTLAGIANSHHSICGQDNVLYWCDANFLGSVFENTGSAFDPTMPATYTYAQKALTLPFVEKAVWLTEQGVYMVIAGVRNYIYQWDRTSTSFQYPIMLPEYAVSSLTTGNIMKLVTLNTNVYIFTGNRGRIYISNSTQATLYKKVPDFISGTVNPYFTWGAVGFNRNQVYFGVLATTNSGGAISQYGGLWAIDTESNAIRLTNQLSYGTYAGYATLFIPQYGNVGGSGFFAGWDNGSSTFGVDTSSSTPYTGGQSIIDSDMIPVGTFLDPVTPAQVEFKLNRPIVSGESVQLLARNKPSDSFVALTGGSSTNGTVNTVGAFSGYTIANLQGNQWLQVRAALTSTASSPSYVRLAELRIRS